MKKGELIITAALTAALTLSCTEDMDVSNVTEGKDQPTISFAVDDTQDWLMTEDNVGETRAVASAFAPRELPAASPDGNNGMTVSMSVVNGMDTRGLNDTDGKTTRGTVLKKLDDSFSISGYYYQASTAWEDLDWTVGNPSTLFFGKTATKDNDGKWSLASGETYYWPDKTNAVRFFAYSPASTGSNGITPSSADYQGTPYLDVTVSNEDVEHQLDLMTAASAPAKYDVDSKSAVLPFKHAMTCVQFAVGSGFPSGAKIKNIKLYNVVSKGRYVIGGNWTPSTADNDKVNYAIQNLNFSTSQTSSIIEHPDGKAHSTLLLIPQEFTSDDQYLEVKYEVGGSTTIITAILNGTIWRAGTTVTYTINTIDHRLNYIFQVTSASAGYKGGEATYTVTSYRQQVGSSVQTAIPWKVIGYSTDGGTTYTAERPKNCNWFALKTTSGNGGPEPDRGVVIIDGQTGTAVTTNAATAQTNLLKAKTARGTTDNPFDLSTHDLNGNPTLMNTANCYIVNAPGTYKIPLVYGNAIKDGQPNTAAYSHENFKNYWARSIEHPWINDDVQNTAERIATARLLWQDAQNLIRGSSVKLTADGNYLQFTITADDIKQGNAVIAAYDSDEPNGGPYISWSWHIWVTATDIESTTTVYNMGRSKFEFMPVNLGWCMTSGNQMTYPAREVWVKVQQEGGNVGTIKIAQKDGLGAPKTVSGNAPFYQWGRKDPMQPSTGTTNANKPIYDGNGNSVNFSGEAGDRSYIYSIFNPMTFYTKNTTVSNNTFWCKDIPYNAWDANSTAFGWTPPRPKENQEPLKTIYDPCPVGFHVPSSWSMTFFVDYGWYAGEWQTSNSSTKITNETVLNCVSSNMTSAQKTNTLKTRAYFEGDFANGYNFYTDGDFVNTIFFPANGYRRDVSTVECSPSASDVGSGYWHCLAVTNKARGAWVCDWMLYPWYEEGESWIGFYIRPIKDEE